MLELIERLEKAEAGSRELDGAVWYAAFEPDVEHGCLHVEQTEQGPREVLICELGSKWADDVGRYTTSIEAALALAERVLPDTDDCLHSICVWPSPRGGILAGPSARIFRQVRDDAAEGGWALAPAGAGAQAATAPLALCIAILRALRTTEQHSPATIQEER